MLTFSVLSVVKLQYNCCSVCWVLAWGGWAGHQPPESWGVRGEPHCPSYLPTQNRKGWGQGCARSFFWFPCCHLRQFLSNIFFFLLTTRAGFCPMYLSQCRMWYLLAWVSRIFWISAKDTNAAISCCCFCVAVSSGEDVYLCSNIDNIL